MSNYCASCRTNYFQVKDENGFVSAMTKIPSIELIKKEHTFAILGTSGDGWPYCIDSSESDGGMKIDLPVLVSSHLADEEVAIFMEAGAEKLRCICGYAEAINNKGERRSVNLEDIYKFACELGSNVTQATD